jgi:hypothetical protein
VARFPVTIRGVATTGAGGRPDNSLPGGEDLVDPGYGIEGGLRPDNSLPGGGLGIWGGPYDPPHVDNTLPGLPVGPNQDLPLPPNYVDNSLPPIVGHPDLPPPLIPAHPIYPVPPNVETPPLGAVWPPLPYASQDGSAVTAIMKCTMGAWGERFVVVDPSLQWPGTPPAQPKG